MSDVAAAIEWCIENKMDIISMSLGGGSADNLVQAAVTRAYQAGILLVTAAGNSGNSDGTGDNVSYPAKFPEVIAVAATDSSEIKSKLAQSVVDLVAPGRDPQYGYGLVLAPAAVREPEPDTRPPRVFFKSPAANETVSEVVKIELLVQDPSGVASVKLSIDGMRAAEWTAPPYIYYWDTRKVPAGLHSLNIEAVDGAGNYGQANLQVDVGATVTILEPKDGWFIKDDLKIKAAFSDNALVTKAELYVDGTLKASKTPVQNYADFIWDSREVRVSGQSRHVIKVVAVTKEALETSASVAVIIRNPVATIFEPVAGSVVTEDKVRVATHATDADGIEKVEFLVDRLLAGTVFSPPYNLDINVHDLPVGSHAVKSVAYCKVGHVAESRETVFKKPTAITFISPHDGDIIGGRYNVTVSFADPVTIADLFINNKRLGSYKTVNGRGPVSWEFDTTGYPDLTTVTLRVDTYGR